MIWCSPAPTISHATADWDCCSRAAALRPGQIGQAVEGYAAARALHAVAARAAVEMPLSAVVYRVLYEGLSAEEAVRELMSRPLKTEAE